MSSEAKRDKVVISGETLVPVTLVCTLAAAAMSFGVMWQQVAGLKAELAEFKQDTKAQLSQLDDKVDRLLTTRGAQTAARTNP